MILGVMVQTISKGPKSILLYYFICVLCITCINMVNCLFFFSNFNGILDFWILGFVFRVGQNSGSNIKLFYFILCLFINALLGKLAVLIFKFVIQKISQASLMVLIDQPLLWSMTVMGRFLRSARACPGDFK